MSTSENLILCKTGIACLIKSKVCSLFATIVRLSIALPSEMDSTSNTQILFISFPIILLFLIFVVNTDKEILN